MNNDNLFEDLLLAVATGAIDIVEHLIVTDGVNVCQRDSRGHSPLDVAAAHGRESVVEFLIRHRADPRASISSSQMTPLHIAAANGHPSVVRILLEYGCDRQKRDFAGASPSDYASMPPQFASSQASSHEHCTSVDEHINSMRLECRNILLKPN